MTATAATAPARIDWGAELRGLALLLTGVVAIHSLVAKPFYIPSESMVPTLRTGDHLIVSKYPYGWGRVSITFHLLPPGPGRIAARMPVRGDIVVVTPADRPREDWVKRVVGLPGDVIAMRRGVLIINGRPVPREAIGDRRIAVDANMPCSDRDYPGRRVADAQGREWCELPMVRETLPNGRTYLTVDLGQSLLDDMAPLTVPANHLFLMGDNRDRSSDSRAPSSMGGLGGPVALDQIGGRAEFITFSLDGSSKWWNPVATIGALRSNRAGTSLRQEDDVP